MDTSSAAKIVDALSNATAGDLDAIDAEVERLELLLDSLHDARGLIARRVGVGAPKPHKAKPAKVKRAKAAPVDDDEDDEEEEPRAMPVTAGRSPETAAHRIKLARILIARGGAMTRSELCAASGISGANAHIDGYLKHAWFSKDDDGYRITTQGRIDNED